eukprot:CAMPEP_0197851168 /NCGR_PEP_ID=MMETSP1438-20131217/17430_1 /TAXON_ID=1461541 /ORGANISM="Pterosperma sp., Strain CCMP1384" /LENGTH=149 /DNA_ID=CAMNT_0043464671 /DNA_START=149 /DNA_END=595 /DNA_ORIENTATION=+
MDRIHGMVGAVGRQRTGTIAAGRRASVFDEFEFTERDKKVILKVSKAISKCSGFLLANACVQLGLALLNLAKLRVSFWSFSVENRGFDIMKLRLFNEALVQGILGMYLKEASTGFSEIIDTKGHDLRNLMLGLQGLEKAFLKQSGAYRW